MEHIDYMQRAYELACLAAKQDEVPIGCVIVNPQNGEIVSEALKQYLSEDVYTDFNF